MDRNEELKAFTLVELAIVLVIIGLLVGGVLVGRDLIERGKISATIDQLNSFHAAVNTFRDKYAGLPGDLLYTKAIQWGLFSTGMTGAAGEGDGNGLLQSDHGLITQPRPVGGRWCSGGICRMLN